jgi:hypothetical protein
VYLLAADKVVLSINWLRVSGHTAAISNESMEMLGRIDELR